MTGARYVWIVEYEDTVISPQRVQVREVVRAPGVSDEDLERHLHDVAIPAQARASTRDGGPSRQLLVKLTGERTQATGFANDPEDVAAPLDGLAVVVTRNGEVLWSSDRQPAM